MTIANEIIKLDTQRKALADNLVIKSVVASQSETLSELVPKVLQVPQEGGGGPDPPTGAGRVDTHVASRPANTLYTGVAQSLITKETFWLAAVVFSKPAADDNLTVNIRYSNGDIIETVSNFSIPAATPTVIELPAPIKLVVGQTIFVEFLFSASSQRFYYTSSLYKGVLWDAIKEIGNSYLGAAWNETTYLGLVEYDG